MPEWIQDAERRLRRQGCPPATVARLIGELKDHHADLEEQAARDGLNADDAREFAIRELGCAGVLADRFILMRRRCDWWGRHPRFLFGLMPLLLFVLGYAGAVMAVALTGELAGWWQHPAAMPSGTWMGLMWSVPLFRLGLLLYLAVLACRLAGHYCYGWKWALLACVVLALHACFQFFEVVLPLSLGRGHVTWGYGFSNDWESHLAKGLPPMLVFAWYLLRFRFASPVHAFEESTPATS